MKRKTTVQPAYEPPRAIPKEPFFGPEIRDAFGAISAGILVVGALFALGFGVASCNRRDKETEHAQRIEMRKAGVIERCKSCGHALEDSPK